MGGLNTPKLYFQNKLSDLIRDQVVNDKTTCLSGGRGKILVLLQV